MSVLDKINLFAVVVSVLVFLFLGFFVYFNNRKSATNRAFLFFAVVEIIWNIVNYLSYQFYLSPFALWIARMTIFSAVWLVFSIFNFIYIFPKEKANFGRIYTFALIPFVAFVSLLTLTSFVFNKIETAGNAGLKVISGPLIFLFGLTIVGLIISGMIILIRRMAKIKGAERNQYEFILTGVSITFMLHIIFNFVFPSFLNNLNFVSMGGIFTFPFLFFAIYAIFKYRLFNLKVIAAEFLTFAIWITLLVKVFLAENQTDKIVSAIIFAVTIIFGIMLIKSVLKEIKIKEEMQKLYGDLKLADEKLKKVDEEKSEFIFITSHQLRSPMTVIKGYISMVMEGGFGKISDKMREALNKVYISNDRLIKLINNLLDLSRIERGKMEYNFKKGDLEKIVLESIEEIKMTAEDKGLNILFDKMEDKLPNVLLDEDYIRQVVVNLIDNAIKYADKGDVEIKIEQTNGSVLLSVKDEGKGISKDTLPHLFERYSRGRKTHSKAAKGIGLGLYIAKKIIDDHHGKIWAESKGEGRGATFFVELSVAG